MLPKSLPSHDERLFVCHIIFRLDYGGLENGLVNLINQLPNDRYRHAIICLSHATAFRKRITRPDVRIFEMHKREGKDLRLYPCIWKILRSLKPDIVHTRNLPTLDMLVPAALAGVKRLVHSEHGLDVLELEGQNAKYNRLRSWSRLIVDRYVCLSRDLKQWLHNSAGVDEHRVALIYNGVDTQAFRPLGPGDKDPRMALLPPGFAPSDSILIGTIGRLALIKDHVNLAKAFVRLCEWKPDLAYRVRLIILGEGSERAKIETVLREHDADRFAYIPGFLDNSTDWYRVFDIFALPSRREGISNTLLEAMASSLPVVATNVGGNPEIIRHNVTGQLVEAQNPDALAAALLRYIEDRELAASHGRCGRQHVLENFSLDAMTREYRDLYEAL